MVYINGIGSISIQGLEKPELPDWGKDNYLRCSEPDFSKYTSPILSRRMSKIIKRSIVASKLCLEDANVEMPDTIISGTGLGCIEETEKWTGYTLYRRNREAFIPPCQRVKKLSNKKTRAQE